MEIQDGSKGEGLIRYHCLECPRTDQCQDCYDLKMQLLQRISSEEKTRDLLNAFDTHLQHGLVPETNIPVFLRFPVAEAPTLSSALHNAFK
jgi:hypothetical protein